MTDRIKLVETLASGTEPPPAPDPTAETLRVEAQGIAETLALATGATAAIEVGATLAIESAALRATAARRTAVMGATAVIAPREATAAVTPREATAAIAPEATIGLEASPPANAPAPDRPGYVVAQRYRLAAIIGRGAHGRVWEAEDLITGGRVALKMLSPDLGASGARIRREVASMRLLRLSGVVQLLDEGTDGDRPFLVMERVHGAPFPGLAGPTTWDRLAPAAIALLSTLSRMHAVGIVHRDLKPANVLVDAEGRPMILDFGLSRVDSALDEGITDHGSILGTPAYLAPEQVLSDPTTARSDLYSVGVMLFEALSGRFPHPLTNVMRMLQARVRDPPAPLRDVAPSVPGAVAEIIDAMLARQPEDRPRSAAEVLDRLRGRREAERPSLRRLGSDAPVRALCAAAAAGRSMDVYGARGSGRSRCLDDVAAELSRAGKVVIRAAPGRVSEDPGGWAGAVAGGAVILIDDAAGIDARAAAAAGALRTVGSVIRAFTGAPPRGADAVQLAPLAEEDLRALFSGTSRLFHIPEDAARVLHRRTDGVPARIADDVTGWIHAALARWDDDRVSVDRDVIERLEAGLLITPLGPLPPPPIPLPPDLDDLLLWIVVAHPHADADHLAAARGEPRAALDAELSTLEACGAVRLHRDGRVEPLCAPGASDGWDLDRRREIHRRIAFAAPPGTPRRLYHLITGADDDVEMGAEIASEARHLARRLAVEGQLGLAAATVSEGLRAERRLGLSGAVQSLPLLTLAVEIALEDGTPRALDRALYELYRIRPRSQSIEKLSQLVRAGLAVGQRTERAFAAANELTPFADRNLERRRHALRVMGVRVRPIAEEQALLEEIRVWAEGSPDLAGRASYAGWMGRLCYREGRFAEAADLHAQAADNERFATARLTALLRSASARMEAAQLDLAASTATRARDDARRQRLPFYEAWAEWILRSSRYRRDEVIEPDLELCEASADLNIPDMEAMLCLNEAAIAYRLGDAKVALSLARRAQRAWAGIGEVSGGALLAAALALASGGEAASEDVGVLVRRAIECREPEIGIQALGLMARVGKARLGGADGVADLVDRIPDRTWDRRLEVLSVREALEAISGR